MNTTSSSPSARVEACRRLCGTHRISYSQARTPSTSRARTLSTLASRFAAKDVHFRPKFLLFPSFFAFLTSPFRHILAARLMLLDNSEPCTGEVSNAYLRSDQRPGHISGGTGPYRARNCARDGGPQHRRSARFTQRQADGDILGARPYETRGCGRA